MKNDVMEVLALVWGVDHELRRLSKKMESTLGITGPQRLAIRVLGKNPDMTAGDLARALRLHPSTLTGILRRLEDGGFVKRVKDPSDARRARLVLTAKGRKFDTDSAGTVEAAVRDTLKNLSAKEADAGRAMLTALASSLQKAAKK